MQAYAVARKGTVLVDTVSSTPRAAMVNWLVAEAGQMVFANETNERIRRRFLDLYNDHRILLVRLQLDDDNFEDVDPSTVSLI